MTMWPLGHGEGEGAGGGCASPTQSVEVKILALHQHKLINYFAQVSNHIDISTLAAYHNLNYHIN